MIWGRFKSFFFHLSGLIFLENRFSNSKQNQKENTVILDTPNCSFCNWNKLKRILSFNKMFLSNFFFLNFKIFIENSCGSQFVLHNTYIMRYLI